LNEHAETFILLLFTFPPLDIVNISSIPIGKAICPPAIVTALKEDQMADKAARIRLVWQLVWAPVIANKDLLVFR
jgi:hypothetical protein